MFKKLNENCNMCLNQDTLLNNQSPRYELEMRPRPASVANWTKRILQDAKNRKPTCVSGIRAPFRPSPEDGLVEGGFIWHMKDQVYPPTPDHEPLMNCEQGLLQLLPQLRCPRGSTVYVTRETPHRTFLKLESAVGKLYNAVDFVSYLEFCSCLRYDCSKVRSSLETPCIALQQGDRVSSDIRRVWFRRQCCVCVATSRVRFVCVYSEKENCVTSTLLQI
jgi:hypothetical protein